MVRTEPFENAEVAQTSEQHLPAPGNTTIASTFSAESLMPRPLRPFVELALFGTLVRTRGASTALMAAAPERKLVPTEFD